MNGPETASEAPATLGPYRVERLLGRGGMGEVYLGYDDRLGRPVALKRIQPDAGGEGESRARFQREARTLARLSHGNVVQIHDWVEADGADWLVMELVEGEALGDRLRTGPLAPAEAVRIARGIAAGLAAAHRAGIVHRDLKPGNVVLTPEGEVKVLDFGLAKSYARGEDADFTTHAVPGQLLGTVQYMSPEQALGLATDHRSDLFSFGTLLYEMLTGRLPFGGDKTVETLTRICTLVQPPAGQGSPEVPATLSRLVDRLLAKDPVRRPQRTEEVAEALDRVEREIAGGPGGGASEPATEQTQATTAAGWLRPGMVEPPAPALVPRRRRRLVAAGVVAVALVGAGVWAWLARPPRVVPVAVPPTVAAGGVPDAAQRLAVEAVHTGLLRALLGLQAVAVREPAPGDPVVQPVALARALAAEEILTSSLDCADAVCRVQLRRVRGGDGSLLWIQTFSIPADDLLRSSALVAEVARSAWPESAARPGLARLAVGAGDFARFLELRRRYQQRDSGTATGELLGQLVALQKSSPRFLEAWLLELPTMARRRFGESREAGALERAFAALAEAERLAPDDPRTLAGAFDLDLAAGRLDGAARVLARARAAQPGDANLLAWEAALLERRGQSDKARAVLAEAARREPSWIHLSELADMASRAGDHAAAKKHLEAALARSPNRFNGLSRLAELSFLHGSLERAAALYRQLAARSPGDAELMNLGVAWLLLGRYQAAEEQFRHAVRQTPDSPYALLNLADAEQLAGDRRAALPLYEKAAAAAARDPDPAALLPVRAQALAQLGRGEEAVAAIQPALRAAPNNPEVLYGAALVFTLVGDQTSALWHARRALAAGMDRRWFTLPWFRVLLPRLDAAPVAPGSEGTPRPVLKRLRSPRAAS